MNLVTEALPWRLQVRRHRAVTLHRTGTDDVAGFA
jgi:hypothetical protein